MFSVFICGASFRICMRLCLYFELTPACYFQGVSPHLSVSLVGGSSIHKWFEIAVSYCSGRLVLKRALVCWLCCHADSARLNNVAHALMISLAEEKSYSLALFHFFIFLKPSGRSRWCVSSLFKRGGKLKGTKNMGGSQRRCVTARIPTSARTGRI